MIIFLQCTEYLQKYFMKRKIIFLVFVIIFLSFSQTFWENIFISSVLPNTSNDTLDEYIELTNYWVSDIYLSWFSIKDKSQKIYIFDNQVIHSQESKKFYRPETMILLNNTDEELWLYDNSWVEIDYFSYTTSSKDVPIITNHQNSPPVDNSWVTDMPRFVSTGGILDITNNWARLSWLTFTWADFASISWGTWELIFTWIISNGEYIFSQLLEDTSYLYRVDLVSETWAIIDFFTWSFITSWYPITADRLYYSDSDNNSKIDLLEIEFNKFITWSLDYSKIKIYSNTWGLSDRLINTETWLISSFEIISNVLKLRLVEQNNNKTTLNITNTTLSDLRIKSLEWLWITDLSGNSIPIFSLTSSFDNYINVSKRENSTGSVDSGSWVDNSGENLLSTWAQILVDIPDIIVTFQQPSYVFQDDLWSNEYFCDQTKTECKINFLLDNSFTGSFESNNYRCEINYWTGNIINDCNPDTYIFPYWSYNISFKIIDKSNSANYKEKNIKLYNIYETLVIPDPKITIQSWLDSANNCTKGDCIINPTWDDSFLTSQNSKYSCLWSFSWWVYSESELTKCNPWYIHYWYWNFIIKLRIFESWNESNYKESSISFSNQAYLWSGWWGSVPINLNNNNRPHSIITLQWTNSWKNRQVSGNKLICITSVDCSVNFTGDKSFSLNSTLTYYWNFGNNRSSILKNPTAINYSSWNYQVTLTVKDATWLSDSSYFYIEVIDEQITESQDLVLKKTGYKNLKQYKTKIDIWDVTLAGFKSKTTKNIKQEVINETDNIEDKSFLKQFDKLFLKVGDELDSVNNYKIFLQWKIGKNLQIHDNNIECFWRKNCKINLSLTWGKIEWYSYVWSYPNGEKFNSYNPKTVTFNFGKYTVSLSVYDEQWTLILTKKININVSKLLNKSSKIKWKTTKIKKPSSFGFIFNKDIVQKWVELINKIWNTKLILIFITIFLIIHWTAILLSKYKSVFSWI